MLRKFFPGKLARFAILMLFVFLPAQSGVVRAQNSAGYILEAVAPVSVAHDIARPPLQSGVILTAIGQACDENVYLNKSGCVSWIFDFDPAGGPISGSYDGTLTSIDQLSGETNTVHISGTIAGDFDGGDGGYVQGQYSGQFVYSQGHDYNSNGEEITQGDGDGSWCGHLSADGTGNGEWMTYCGFGLPPSEAVWSVTFDAQAFQDALHSNLEPNPNPNPNPEPNPEPNPNPDPGPIGIDSETLRILQSILSTPGLPITGAVAGGLVAWIISMLGGGRPVLPTAPRPPTGGVRPGQMGPDGKIWSPGQGWVSKSTYDYQQKWLHKGWRLNPQTNKLEVQPGAVNESGQVWYKLPHEMDEGDSYYWVDKPKVQEVERNLAEGKLWDRNLDWQAPDDLKQIHSDQDAIHRRSIIDNAAKNAQIQKEVQDASQKRLQEYQDWLKQYEHKEQVLQNMDAAQDEFRRQRAIDNKLALKELLLNAAALPVNAPDAIAARMFPSSIGEFYQGAYDSVKETASDLKEFYKGAYDSMKETASEVKGFYADMYDGAKQAAGEVKDFYGDMYDGAQQAADDIKDLTHLMYHDGLKDEISKEIGGKISDWTTKFTKNAVSKYTESPIKKQFFDTYGKPALQGAQGVGGTLKDKAFEAAAGDFPEKAVDLVFDQAEKHPELIR